MATNNIITKKSLIKAIAKACGRDILTVKDVINTLDDVFFDILSSVDQEHEDVVVRLFEGISFESKYIHAKEKLNNLTGKVVNVDGYIKPKCHITRSYSEKINGKK